MQHAYEVQAHVDTDKSSKGLAHTFLLLLFFIYLTESGPTAMTI